MSSRTKEEYTRHFNAAEAVLRERGYKVFNPVRWGWLLRRVPYRVALAFDLLMMCFCDRVYMLRGWIESGGASVEYRFACVTGMVIDYE